jgi:hypothetical protein
MAGLGLRAPVSISSVADSLHLDADLDADPDFYLMRTRIRLTVFDADAAPSYPFVADLDPSYHFDADQDPDFYFSRIRILILSFI